MTEPIDVDCPDCLAASGTPCGGRYGTHAERTRIAALRSLEQGTCDLCGALMVRDPDGTNARHPDERDAAACPPLPDPRTDWNAYALALQTGLAPGRPGDQHFHPIHDPLTEAMERHGVTSMADVNADNLEDLLVAAATAAIAVCPECANGKCINCDGRALHPVTEALVPCQCTHTASLP